VVHDIRTSHLAAFRNRFIKKNDDKLSEAIVLRIMPEVSKETGP